MESWWPSHPLLVFAGLVRGASQVVGELKKGDTVYVLERDEVAPGVTRAQIALDSGAPPKGWITASKDGVDFVSQMGVYGSPRLGKDAPMHLKMKFHMFSFRTPMP